jgi:hypothetical protein
VGWARFAREQNRIENGSNHRRFGALRQRCLYYDEVRLAFLEEQLLQLDKHDEATDKMRLRTPSPAQLRTMGKDVDQVCAKDELIVEITSRLDNYSQFFPSHGRSCSQSLR